MKKLLKLNQTKYCEMSFEETLVKYDNLVRKRAMSYRAFYEIEDMLQIAKIALWYAFNSYENIEVGFGYYANIVIVNELNKYHQINKAKLKKTSSKVREIVSLNYNISNNEDEVVEKIDLLVDESDFVDEILDKEIIRLAYERIKTFSERDSHIVTAYINGDMKQKELAQLYGVSPKRINHIYQRALRDLKKYFENKLGA